MARKTALRARGLFSVSVSVNLISLILIKHFFYFIKENIFRNFHFIP